MKHLISVADYAKQRGVSRAWIHNLIIRKDYRIKIMRIGNRLFVDSVKSNFVSKKMSK